MALFRARALALYASLLCLLLFGLPSAAVAGAGEPEFHNYLEKFNTAALDLGRHHHDPKVRLSYNISELSHSGQWVEVAFEGVAEPSTDDVVALFVPADGYRDGAAPVKYANASEAPGYLETGAGSLRQRLVNLRGDMRFVFIRGGVNAPRLASEGAVIRNGNPNEPTGIHLMLGHRPLDMLVQWSTRDVGRPIVRYGTSPGRYDYVVPAVTDTYTRADMCGGAAAAEGWVDPGQLHTAVMTGMEPSTRYFYQVGDAESGVWADAHTFVSHPGVGPDLEVAILAVADQGVGEPDGATALYEYQAALNVSLAMIADAERGWPGGNGGRGGRGAAPFTLALHNGDVSYARGYGALWDTFLLQQGPVARRMPYMTAIGNHERDWPHTGSFYKGATDSGGECGVPYRKRFPMPNPIPDHPWYSFDYGPAHFTYISSEHDFTDGSAQFHWIQGDLAAVDRDATPWLILVSHRPMYIDADDFDYPTGKQTTAIQLQTALEHLLDHYRVDVMLAGHHHSYQRTCAVHKKECRRGRHGEPGAPVHITHGNGGAEFYDNGFAERPEWAEAVFMETHGYLRLYINGTSFQVQAVDVADGSIHDEVSLYKRPRRRRAATLPWSEEARLEELTAALGRPVGGDGDDGQLAAA